MKEKIKEMDEMIKFTMSIGDITVGLQLTPKLFDTAFINEKYIDDKFKIRLFNRLFDTMENKLMKNDGED